jgi:hypothetical protein
VKVIITGPDGFERGIAFAVDEDAAVIAERVRARLVGVGAWHSRKALDQHRVPSSCNCFLTNRAAARRLRNADPTRLHPNGTAASMGPQPGSCGMNVLQ